MKIGSLKDKSDSLIKNFGSICILSFDINISEKEEIRQTMLASAFAKRAR